MLTMSNLGMNEKEGTAAVRVSKMKKLNGRSYKEWMNSLAKAKRSDPSIRRKRNINEVNDTVSKGSEEDDTTNSDSPVSHTRQKRVLKRVKNSSNVEKSNILNDSPRTKLQKRRNNISEIQCNMDVPSTTKFVEYWVPVRLSNVQTELYCGSLFSNSGVLCSSKLYITETFHKIIVSTRKCCDHPYLVDSSMCESLIQCIPEPEKLDAEIKLSSKLLLLHKILQEISKRGLRVVILYQAYISGQLTVIVAFAFREHLSFDSETLGGHGPISTGHILDDIIHEKFGEDSYVRIDEGLSKSKMRAVLNSYNDQGSGKFICLMPTRACVPSIHLQSVDIAIFFNSDWDPMNDLRALQKIKLDSQLKHVKVFRLYSAFTLEEKLLMLSKQSSSPEGKLMNIRRNTCNGLLTWGAYYLFEKLDEFHGSTTDGTQSVISDADSFVDDVFLELSNLLPNSEDISVHSDSSFIMEVQQNGGLYPRNICLLGEVEYPLMKNYSVVEKMMRKEPAYVLWINLLQGRKPSWKYFSSQSPRTRKCVQRFNDIFEASVHASKKRRAEARMRSVNELQSRDKESLLPGEAAAPTTRQAPMLGNPFPPEPCSLDEQGLQTAHTASSSRTNVPLSCLNSQPPETSQLTQSQVPQSVKEFQGKLERLKKQKTELLKQHKDKKLQAELAREKEIHEINKKYEIVLQNADMAFVEEIEVLDTTYNKVFANKLLAEAMLQRENSDLPRGQHMRNHLGNIQPSYQMTAPAPHLRPMVRPLSSTQPLLLSSRCPEIIFSPVSLQPKAL